SSPRRAAALGRSGRTRTMPPAAAHTRCTSSRGLLLRTDAVFPRQVRVQRLLLMACLLGACGLDPIDQTRTGSLDDGDPRLRVDQSPYEAYPVELREGWRIVAEMHSASFDPYLHLIDPENRQIEQNDDVGPNNHDARIEHVATSSGTYQVIANAARPE